MIRLAPRRNGVQPNTPQPAAKRESCKVSKGCIDYTGHKLQYEVCGTHNLKKEKYLYRIASSGLSPNCDIIAVELLHVGFHENSFSAALEPKILEAICFAAVDFPEATGPIMSTQQGLSNMLNVCSVKISLGACS